MLQSKLRYHLTLQNFWWSHFKLRQKEPTQELFQTFRMFRRKQFKAPQRRSTCTSTSKEDVEEAAIWHVSGSLWTCFAFRSKPIHLLTVFDNLYSVSWYQSSYKKNLRILHPTIFLALLGCGDLYWVWWTKHQEGGTRKWDRHPHQFLSSSRYIVLVGCIPKSLDKEHRTKPLNRVLATWKLTLKRKSLCF